MHIMRLLNSLQHATRWLSRGANHYNSLTKSSSVHPAWICGDPFVQSLQNLARSVHSPACFSSLSSVVTDTAKTVTWRDGLNGFLEAYKAYKESVNALFPNDVERPPSTTDTKRHLKFLSRSLANNMQGCDLTSATALVLCITNISRKCRLTELHKVTLQYLLRELRAVEDEGATSYNALETATFNACIDTKRLEDLQRRDVLIAFLIGTLRQLDIKNPPKDMLDDIFVLVNSTLYIWSPFQLVNIARELAWISRFADDDRFSDLLRKCISVALEATGKTNRTFTRGQLMTLLKAASVIRDGSNSLAARLNDSIMALVRMEADAVPVDLSERINVLYRRTKGNVHMMHIMLLTGLPVDTTVVQTLLEIVMEFCLQYFAATCSVWKLKRSATVTHDYNTIDPRISHILYAKYPNKVFRAPGSLVTKNDTHDAKIKLEERYQAVVASLSRLLVNGKVAFCRGIKLCEVRLRVFNTEIYHALDDHMRMLLKAVSSFRFEEPIWHKHKDLRRALRHLGYKPIHMMVDGTFPVNCIDYKRRLYCELCNGKEVRLSHDGSTVYNKTMELKLRYLELTGWKGATILAAEWQRIPEHVQVALLRRKLAPFNEHCQN